MLRSVLVALFSLFGASLAAQSPPAAASDSFRVAFWPGSLPVAERFPFVRERLTLLDGRVVLDDSIPPACLAADTLGHPLPGIADAVRFIDSTGAWRRLRALGPDSLDHFDLRASLFASERDLPHAMSDDVDTMLVELQRRDPPVFSTWCQGTRRFYVWSAARRLLFQWIRLPRTPD